MVIKRLDSLSVKDLRAVAILADLGNFHRAADLCNISQPALSSIIKKVEAVLEIQLFKRSSRSFEITKSGYSAVKKIRLALGILGAISDEAVPKRPLEDSFRLGFIPTIGPYFIPELIRPLLSRFPKLELSFTETTTNIIVEMLIGRKIDAAIVALPIHHTGISEIALFQEELVLAVSSKHPFSRRANISISEVKQEDLLLMEQGHCLRGNTIEICGNESKNARTVHSASLDTLLFMVQAGIGYTVVPDMVAAFKNSNKAIKFIRFEKPAPTRTIGLISLHANPLQLDVEALVDFLRTGL